MKIHPKTTLPYREPRSHPHITRPVWLSRGFRARWCDLGCHRGDAGWRRFGGGSGWLRGRAGIMSGWSQAHMCRYVRQMEGVVSNPLNPLVRHCLTTNQKVVGSSPAGRAERSPCTARTFTDVLFVDAAWQGNLWEPFSRSDYTSREITEEPHSHNMCLIDDVGGAAGLSPDLVIEGGYRCVRCAAIVRP